MAEPAKRCDEIAFWSDRGDGKTVPVFCHQYIAALEEAVHDLVEEYTLTPGTRALAEIKKQLGTSKVVTNV